MEQCLTECSADDLEQIDFLRVDADIDALTRATDKGFSLCCNCAKGEGDHFVQFMNDHCVGSLLTHCDRGKGSQQDLAMEGACPICFN